MNTISLELSKRLNDWWYLDNIETEYFYWNWWDSWYSLRKKWEARNIHFLRSEWDYKTLTLEEVIKLYWKHKSLFSLIIHLTSIEKAEESLTYLLDNNLLPTE